MTLLFDAYSAYLGPLLEKHSAGKSIVWEDLMTSYAASKTVLQSSDNYFVSVSFLSIECCCWNHTVVYLGITPT